MSFRCTRSRVAVAALMLVVFLLSGCLGQKTFTVTVEITPALAGVNIHENSETGTLKAITDEAGMAEIKNVKSGTILVPVREGYSFKPKNAKVTKAGAPSSLLPRKPTLVIRCRRPTNWSSEWKKPNHRNATATLRASGR